MYYLFKNKKVDKINDDIIKINKINEDEIIKVDEVKNDIIEDIQENRDEDTEIKDIKEKLEDIEIKDDGIMPSLPIRLRKPIRNYHKPKSFSLSIFSYKIIDVSANNALTLGVGVGLGIGLSIGVCLGALISISLTSSSSK
jgi:hypothetical protein